MSIEPGRVRLFVRVERNTANRSLVVELESPEFFRSSLITLEGESAQAAYTLEFGSLPAGPYTVTASLRRVHLESTLAADSFTVVPRAP